MNSKTIQSKNNRLFDINDLLFLWRMIYKNLVLLILLPVIFYIGGYIYAYRLTNIYGAEAQLLLKSNETYDYQDPIYRGLGAYNTYTDIQNQIRILKSRDLIGEVIDKLDLTISQYVVGRLRRQEVFFTLPFNAKATVHENALFETPLNIAIKDRNNFNLTYEYNGEQKSYTHEFGTPLVTSELTLTLEKLYGFDDDGLEVIKQSNYELVIHSRDFLISKYQSNINVENIEFTSILNLKVTDEIQRRGHMFLDTLCHTYVDYSRRVQLEVNQNTLENIQRQIDTAKRFIEAQELTILDYKENNSILDIDKEGNEYFKEYFDLTKQIRELKEQSSSITELERYLNSNDDGRVLPPYFYIEQSDEYLAKSINTLREKQTALETMRTQVSEENQNFKRAKQEIQLIKNDIRNYLANLKVALNKELNKLNDILNEFKSKITSLPKSAQDIINIQRELDVSNKMYLFLLEKKTNTLITRAGIIPQVRIIEQTRSTGVVRPDKTRIKISTLMVGLIIAFFISLFRTIFFEKVETVKELAEVTSIPIVGGIPYSKDKDQSGLVVEKNPKSQLTESFRTIRTNLNYLGTKQIGKAKKILLSSYFPGEGKTFSSTNIVGLLAKSDKKVLLVDFDLHKPRVHKALNIENKIGVSNFLTDMSELNEVITKVSENLHVITAGTIPPNPSELILRAKVQELFNQLENQYDYIVVDTPPFGLLQDSIELLKCVDIFVVILNTKFSRKSGVRQMETIVNEIPNVEKAFILNGIKMRKLHYYYAKYTYKYGYNYGYGSYGYGGYGQSYDEQN